MFAIKPRRRRIVGVASLTCSLAFVILSFASLPAGAQSVAPSACPVLSLGNPNPADDLVTGGMFISGTAYDPTATQGSGIARVDLFLGERDSGGTFLGSAVPGSTGGDPRAFSVEVTIPVMNRGVDFAAYAISASSGQQTTVTFPVFVGVPPAKNPVATPTPIPTIETVTSTCPQSSSAVVASAPAVAAVATPAAPAVMVAVPGAPAVAAVAAASTCPVLSLGNPNPADNLIAGGMFISGTAYDPTATQGSGVSRVDLFLGERDNGGMFLGSAVPGSAAGGDPRAFSVEVTIPTLNRGVDFAAYAVSARSGQQTTITFPVFVGVPPAKNPVATPTPIPTIETVTSTCASHM
jgi:hypothetical protein